MPLMLYKQMCSGLILFSYARFAIIVGLIGMGTPSIFEVFLVFIGVMAYRAITPYFGFRIQYFKSLDNENDFIPLKRWMVKDADIELSGQLYEELLNEKFSNPTRAKLALVKAQGKITHYDLVNLVFFDRQVGRVIQNNLDSETIKKNIKSKF